MSKRHISRRKVIATAGGIVSAAALYNPIREFVRSIAAGRFRNVRDPKQDPRFFVQFNLYGSPTRWQFDHILRPQTNAPFLPFQGVYNKISRLDNRPSGEYSDVGIHGIRMPHLWSYPVLDANGGSLPLADLARNMLVIRGCSIGMNGHPQPNTHLVCPTQTLSINGVIADAGDFCLPAINVGNAPATQVFRAPSGSFALHIPAESDDYASHIMAPLLDGAAEDDDAEMRAAAEALHALNVGQNPGAEILYRDRRNAELLLKKSLADWKDAYPELERKYERIFHSSMNCSPIAGVTDLPISGVRFPLVCEDGLSLDEALAAFNFEAKLFCGDDLRSVFHSARAYHIHKQFALAEFVITNRLSNSILLSPPSAIERANFLLTDLKDLDYYFLHDVIEDETGGGTPKRFSIDTTKHMRADNYSLVMDSHGVGWLMNLVSSTLFYRGFGACMLELVNRLKATKDGSSHLFDRTVIQVASEFDRIPEAHGAGLEHNPRANITSVFSGMVKEPMVLGNIYASAPGSPGTSGIAAPVKALGDKTISLSHISSTLSEMLGVQKIDPNAPSLVSVRAGRVLSEIEEATNVEI